MVTLNTFSPFSHISSGTGTTTTSTYIPNPSPYYYNLFTELVKLFDINIPEDNLGFLNDLYNSGDASNKIVATEIFKYIMKNEQE